MLVVCFFLGYLVESFAQIAFQGSCPEPDRILNFNETQLIGEWYEWARIENYFQPDMICGLVTFNRNQDGYLIEHYNSIIRRGESSEPYYWDGKMVSKDEVSTGRYSFIHSEYSRDKVLNGTFVDGDWDHWILMYGCKEKSGESDQFAWILTKNLKPVQRHLNEIAASLGKIRLTMDDLSIVDHNQCV